MPKSVTEEEAQRTALVPDEGPDDAVEREKGARVIRVAVSAGSEIDLDDVPEPAKQPSLAPTPSLLPHIRRATLRKRIFLAALIGALLLGGGFVGVGYWQGWLFAEPEAMTSEWQSGFDPGGLLVEPILEEETGNGLRQIRDRQVRGGGGGGVEEAGAPGEAGNSTDGVRGDREGNAAALGSALPTGGTARDVSNGSGPLESNAPGSSSSGGRRGRSLDAEQIRGAIVSNAGTVRRCHEAEMRRINEAVELRVSIRIRIGASGVVRDASISSQGVSGTPLGGCIVNAVRTWRFPAAGAPTTIETPFHLTPR